MLSTMLWGGGIAGISSEKEVGVRGKRGWGGGTLGLLNIISILLTSLVGLVDFGFVGEMGTGLYKVGVDWVVVMLGLGGLGVIYLIWTIGRFWLFGGVGLVV